MKSLYSKLMVGMIATLLAMSAAMILLTLLEGCGGSAPAVTWSAEKCSEKRDYYHRAQRECHERGEEAYCLYARHWRETCRVSGR